MLVFVSQSSCKEKSRPRGACCCDDILEPKFQPQPHPNPLSRSNPTVYLSQTPGPPPYRAPYLRTARQKRHPARLTKGSLHKGSTSPRLAARTPRNTAQRHRTTADISTLTSPSRSTCAMDTCVVVEMSPHPIPATASSIPRQDIPFSFS
jgi:hypothetical protein